MKPGALSSQIHPKWSAYYSPSPQALTFPETQLKNRHPGFPAFHKVFLQIILRKYTWSKWFRPGLGLIEGRSGLIPSRETREDWGAGIELNWFEPTRPDLQNFASCLYYLWKRERDSPPGWKPSSYTPNPIDLRFRFSSRIAGNCIQSYLLSILRRWSFKS